MCRLPVMRAPFSGCAFAYSARIAISAGISLSAMRISLRPQSASDRSATAYWSVCRGFRTAAFIVGSIGMMKPAVHVSGTNPPGIECLRVSAVAKGGVPSLGPVRGLATLLGTGAHFSAGGRPGGGPGARGPEHPEIRSALPRGGEMELHRPPGHALGAVHRGVGVLDQLVAVRAVAREQRHADADRHARLGGGERERRVHDLGQPLGQAPCAGFVGVARHHHELVAAQARQEVGAPRRLRQTRADLADQFVAGVMAVAVVDVLEAVEVHEQHGKRFVLACGVGHLARQRLFEVHAVGQAGQAVEVRQIVQALVGRFELALRGTQRREVGEDAHQHLLAVLADEAGLGGADRAHAAVGVGVRLFVRRWVARSRTPCGPSR